MIPMTDQAALLEDAIRINDLKAEIAALEAMLDDPAAAWNFQQTEFMAAIKLAKERYAIQQQAIAAEAERARLEALAKRPLLQNVWESFLAQANADELTVMRQRDQIFGVGWWLDIPSPFHLDLSTDAKRALVSSAFRAIRLTRFESYLRHKRSRLEQFRKIKKFPSASALMTFLDTSESKSLALRHVLTRHDAEGSVAFMLSIPLNRRTKENSDDPKSFS